MCGLAMRRTRHLDAAAAKLDEELLGMAKKCGADSLSGVRLSHDQNADASHGERPVQNRRRERGHEPDDSSVLDGDEDGVVRGEGLDPGDLGNGESRFEGMTELRQKLRDRAGIVTMGGPNLQPGLHARPHGPTISSAAQAPSAAARYQGAANAWCLRKIARSWSKKNTSLTSRIRDSSARADAMAEDATRAASERG